MAGLVATSTMWPSLLLLLITAWIPLIARPAYAQDERQSALARSLFEEGVALGDRGDWVGAADRFARAHSLKPTSAVAFNWGSALIETGRLVEARERLSSVQQDRTASAELKRECALRLNALARRLAHLRVHVPSSHRDELSLDLDDRPLPRAVWDVDSPVDPGTHVVVLREDGDEIARAELTLVEGERRDITLSERGMQEGPPALRVEASPVDNDRAPKPVWKSWTLWATVGAVLVSGTVIAVVIAKHDGNEQSPTQGNTNPGVIRW